MIKTPPRTIMEVFKCLPEGTLAQVINNHLIRSPAPNSAHQRILKKIFLQINEKVEREELGEVLFAPVDVYLDDENVYEPDLVFISNECMHILRDNIYGAPDMVVEVLSPGTKKYDNTDKKAVYEKHGVKEYWIVDPKTKKVLGYQLSDGRYTEIPAEDGVINSLLLQTTIHF